MAGLGRALHVGVSRVETGALSLSHEAPGCDNAAVKMQALTTAAGYSDAPPLLDEEATSEAIESGVTSLLSGATADDIVCVSFAGHGVPSRHKVTKEHDVTLLTFNGGIRASTLLSWLTGHSPRVVLVVLSCFGPSIDAANVHALGVLDRLGLEPLQADALDDAAPWWAPASNSARNAMLAGDDPAIAADETARGLLLLSASSPRQRALAAPSTIDLPPFTRVLAPLVSTTSDYLDLELTLKGAENEIGSTPQLYRGMASTAFQHQKPFER